MAPSGLPEEKVYVDVLAAARSSCYKERDAFYACVEAHSGRPAAEIGAGGLLYPSECAEARAAFFRNCRPTWVKHFDRQYCTKKRVQGLLGDDSRKDPISLSQPSVIKTT